MLASCIFVLRRVFIVTHRLLDFHLTIYKMVLLITLSLLGLIFFSIVLFVLSVKWFFGLFKSKENQYIKDHQIKIKNDRDYDRYLKWCDLNGVVPEDQEQIGVDLEIMNEIHRI